LEEILKDYARNTEGSDKVADVGKKRNPMPFTLERTPWARHQTADRLVIGLWVAGQARLCRGRSIPG
jgi:hypothetical protein